MMPHSAAAEPPQRRRNVAPLLPQCHVAATAIPPQRQRSAIARQLLRRFSAAALLSAAAAPQCRHRAATACCRSATAMRPQYHRSAIFPSRAPSPNHSSGTAEPAATPPVPSLAVEEDGTAEPAKPGAATSAATASAIQLPAGLATGAAGPAAAEVFLRLFSFALFDGLDGSCWTRCALTLKAVKLVPGLRYPC
jgi:hypothetical protein